MKENESTLKVYVTVNPPQETKVDVVFSSLIQGFTLKIKTNENGAGEDTARIPARDVVWEATAYWNTGNEIVKKECGSIKRTVPDYTEGVARAWESFFGGMIITFFIAVGIRFTYAMIWGVGGAARWYNGKKAYALWLVLLIAGSIAYSIWFPINLP